MIQVIVADDEVNVCKLICNIVDWMSFDMEIAAVAHNGVEVLEYAKRYRPDLIVTDIRMPGIDGLEMIKMVQMFKQDTEFIIISGYGHFEYAKRAIQYHVQDYILKPIKKEDLATALRKMQDKHLLKMRLLSQDKQLQIRQRRDIERLRSGKLSDIVHGRVLPAQLSIEELNQNDHYNLREGIFRIFIARIDYPYEDELQNAVELVMNKLSARLSALLEPECFDAQTLIVGCRQYGIVNYGEAAWDALRRHFKTALDELIVQAGVFGRLELTIGLGDPVTRISEIHASLSSAEAVVAQRLIDGAGLLIEGTGKGAEASAGYSQEFSNALPDLRKYMDIAVDTLDRSQFQIALERFQQKLVNEKRGGTGQMIDTLVRNVYRSFRTLLACKYGQIAWPPEEGDAPAEFERKADVCGSAAELFQLLSGDISQLISRVREELKQVEAKPVRLAKKYIQEHCTEQVTLDDLARLIGMNPSYFSTFFKKETGQNFMEYLSEVRMNNACKMLKETNKTVMAVCEEVGYNDLKHFIKSFKKYSGLKPNEYRRLFS
jgi:two-component system response regulator YesN